MKRCITLVGAAEAPPEDRRRAEILGAHVARIGAVLITGGRGGVMAAASRGCRRAGGTVVAILPGTGPDPENPDVDIAVVTDMGSGRNVINVLSADLVVAIGGGFGTLSEIALALKHGVEVVGLDSWRLERPGVDLARYHRVDTLEEALATVDRLLAARPDAPTQADRW